MTHFTRLAAIVLLACVYITAYARAQSCGTWVHNSTTPDLPYNVNLHALKGLPQGVLVALARDVVDTPLWMYSAGTWTSMPWDRTALGDIDVISTDGGVITVATSRVTASRTELLNGQFVTIRTYEDALRSFDGSQWNAVAVRTYERLQPLVGGQSDHFTDIAEHLGVWYAAVSRSSSSFLSSSTTATIYQANGGSFTEIAHTDTSSCSICLNPNGIFDLLSTSEGLYLAGKWNTLTLPNATQIASPNFVRFTGTTWQPIANTPNAAVRGMFRESSRFVATSRTILWGDFVQIGSVTANHVAVFDPSLPTSSQWSALGAGFNATPSWIIQVSGLSPNLNDIDYMAVMDPLITSGTTTLDGVARWTGSVWQRYSAANIVQPSGVLNVVISSSSGLVIGGSGLNVGGSRRFGVTRFDGASWTTLSAEGTDALVRAWTSHNSDLYAGGDFTRLYGTQASHVARRVGSSWDSLGTGVNGPVHALASHSGELFVGGTFSTAGGTTVNNIASWNGTSWRALGSGFNGTVRALCSWNGSLIAAGAFSQSGALARKHAARWDGSSWQSLDNAIGATDLYACTVYNNQLHVAGETGMWRYSGSAFSPIGGAFNGTVRTLFPLAGSLYVGGDFSTVGGPTNLPYHRLARWNGTQWFGVGPDPANTFLFGSVRAITGDINRLFIAGDLSVSAAEGDTDFLVTYDGVNYHNVPTGTPGGIVYSAFLHSTHLWISGDYAWFTLPTTPLTSVESAFVSEWSPTPIISQQPASITMCEDPGSASVSFTCSVHPGTSLAQRWHSNGVPMNDNLRISGSTTATLVIGAVTPADEGSYTCVITDPCGALVTSTPAVLDINCCPADFNGAGGVTVQDIFDFLTAWFASLPSADFNGSSGVTVQDIFDFLAAWFAGC